MTWMGIKMEIQEKPLDQAQGDHLGWCVEII